MTPPQPGCMRCVLMKQRSNTYVWTWVSPPTQTHQLYEHTLWKGQWSRRLSKENNQMKRSIFMTSYYGRALSFLSWATGQQSVKNHVAIRPRDRKDDTCPLCLSLSSKWETTSDCSALNWRIFLIFCPTSYLNWKCITFMWADFMAGLVVLDCIKLCSTKWQRVSVFLSASDRFYTPLLLV